MTKRELIQAIAAKAGLTNAQAEAALDAFGAVITEALVADKKEVAHQPIQQLVTRPTDGHQLGRARHR